MKNLSVYKGIPLLKNFLNKNFSKSLIKLEKNSLFKSKNNSFINLQNTSNRVIVNNLIFTQKFNFCNNENNKNNSLDNGNNDQKDNLLSNLDIEFEKILEKSDNTELEKRIKILSIKLLQSNSSQEISKLYEEKYVKNFIDISSDEIILILHFFTTLIERETSYNTNYRIKSKKTIFIILQLFVDIYFFLCKILFNLLFKL